MVKMIKKKAPSRTRYEQNHPTVSCRVSREIYERLSGVKEEEGKSFADILKIGLGILEVQAKKAGEVRKQGVTEGYKKGYAEAEILYKVTYLCSVCGKTLVVTDRSEKEAIKTYMREHGWCHTACQQKRP